MTKYIDRYYLNGEEYGIKFGGGGGRQPGANTIAYYPLDSVNQLSDLSGNQNSLTKDGTVTFTDNYAEFDANGRLDTPINTTATNGTVIFYMMALTGTGNEQVPIAKRGAYQDNERWGFYKNSSQQLNVWMGNGWSSVAALTAGNWYMITQTTEGAGTANCVFKVYLNGNTTPVVNTTAPLYNDSSTYIRMGGRPTQYNYRGKLSGVILEDKIRTAQEVADYYNQTKSLYGIS